MEVPLSGLYDRKYVDNQVASIHKIIIPVSITIRHYIYSLHSSFNLIAFNICT